MDKLKFKTEHPEVFAAVEADAVAGVTTKFNEEKSTLEAQITTLTEQNTKLAEDNRAHEKAEAIRQEAVMKHTADAVFAEKFAEAGLPDRLSVKVRKMVSHESFIKDGALDKDAFAAAVDAELKDWTSEDADGTVLGFSTSTKKVEGVETTTKLSKECDDSAARMAKYVNG